MKVRELIAELSKMPPDAEVRTEGCDCSGDVAELNLSGDGVELRRSIYCNLCHLDWPPSQKETHGCVRP